MDRREYLKQYRQSRKAKGWKRTQTPEQREASSRDVRKSGGLFTEESWRN